VATSPAVPVPLPIHLAVAEPDQRDRLTALIRIIMVIPQWIVLFFVYIAALVVVIIGWFAALVTGRLPDFAVNFLSGVLRWDARVRCYSYLLVDKYPPFSLGEEPGYPVQLAIPDAADLNRLTVLFRFFIALPIAIFVGILGYGLNIFSIGSWFMIVFTGRMPKPLFEVTRAVLRYQARLGGFFWMLTPEYPWGIYGEPQETTDATGPGWTFKLSQSARTAMTSLIIVGAILAIINNTRYF
jgi:hypothetical protein